MGIQICAVDRQTSSSLINSKGEEILNSIDKAKYFGVANYFMGKLFRDDLIKEDWLISDLTNQLNEVNFNRVYNNLKIAFKNYLDDGNNKLSTKAEDDILKILENWKAFKKEHIANNSLISTNLQIEDEDEIDIDALDKLGDENSSVEVPTEFERTGNKESTFELMSSEIRTLFKLIPKAERVSVSENDIQIKEQIDSEGLPLVSDFDNIFNLLSEKLAGIKNVDEFKEKLASIDLLKIIPEVKYLNQMLRIDNTTNSLNQLILFEQFYKVFSRPMIQIWSSKLTDGKKEKSFIYYRNVKGNKNKIANSFSNNFQSGNIDDNLLKAHTEIDNREDVGYGRRRLVSIPELSIAVDAQNINGTSKQSLDFLQLIGYKFSGLDSLTNQSEKDSFANILNEAVYKIYNSLKARLVEKQNMYNPYVDLGEDFSSEHIGNISKETSALKALVELESRYSNISPTLSSKNTKNENQYELSLHNAITTSVYYLNHSKTIKELFQTPSFTNLKYNPLFGASYYRKILFDDNENKRNNSLVVRNYNGFTTNGESYMTRDLSKEDKFISDFMNLISEASINTMQLESKSSAYSINVLNKDGYERIPYDVTNFKTSFSNKFASQMFFYLKAEVERINSYPQKLIENPNLANTTKGAYGDFSIFSDMLSSKLKEELKTGEIKINNELGKSFFKEMNAYFNKQVKQVRTYMIENNIQDEDLISSKIKNMYGERIYNAQNEEVKGERGEVNLDSLIRMFVGNAFVLNTEFSIFVGVDPLFIKDYHKRLGMIASTGNLTSTNPEVNEYLDSDEEFTRNETYSPTIAMGYELRQNHFNYQTAVLKELYEPGNAYANGSLIEGFIASNKAKGITTSIDEAKSILNIKGAEGTALGDGQGYITLDGYRELSIRHQFWSDDLELVFKYEGLLFKKQEKLISKAEEIALEEYEKIILKNPDRFAAPVLKFTTVSPIQNATVDMKAGDKFSLRPILPSYTQYHPKLGDLHKAMMKRGILYTKFESGTKLSVRHVYNGVEDLANSETAPDLLSTELLKEQLKTHIEQSVKSIIPTQFNKMLFANLFNNGKSLSASATKLRNDFINLLSDIRDHQKEELYRKLGFTLDSNGEIKDFNAEELVQKIKEEINRQKLNSNILESIKLDKYGNFVNDLESSGAMRQILDYVTGTIDKTLRRYKTNQADFVLISNAYENKGAGGKNGLKYIRYDSEGKIHLMECRITLNKEFSKLLNLPDIENPDVQIGNLNRLNELLKNPDFVKKYQKSLTVVFSRVPIAGPASTGTAIVKEFIFPSAGNVFQVPIEFMHQAGIDFDYDKEKVMLPNLSQDGFYVPHDLKTVENRITKLKQEREGLTFDLRRNNPNVTPIIEVLRNYMKSFKDDLYNLKELKTTEELSDAKFVKNKEIIRDLFTQTSNLQTELSSLKEIREAVFKKYRSDIDSDEIMSLSEDEMNNYIKHSDEYDKVQTMLEDSIDDFNKSIKEVINSEYKKVINEGYKFGEKIEKLSRLARMSKESTINKFTSLITNTLSLPELFSEVILPNNNKDIKDIANRNGNDLDIRANLPTKGQALEYLKNLDVFNIYYTAKALLGPWAITNVFHQMITQQGTKINYSYNPRYNKDTKQTIYDRVNLMLLDNADLSKVLFKDKMGRDKISLASMRDVEGKVIQHLIGQIINATVDSAKDPYFAELQQSFSNINETAFMLHLRIPLDNIVQFMNNPLIQELGKILEKGESRNEALKTLLNRYGIPIEKPTELLRAIDNHKDLDNIWFNGLNYNTNFNFNKLNELKINKNKELKEVNDGKMNQTTFDHLRILAHFVMMGEHSREFSNFKSLFNNDTNKTSSLLQVYAKEQTRKSLVDRGMFDESEIQSFENHSIISPFRNDDVIAKILTKLFPILSNKVILAITAEINKDYTLVPGNSSTNRRLLPKIIENDFIHAVLGTFGTYKGENITDYGKKLIGKYVGNTTLIERLAEFRKMDFYKDLIKEYSVLEKFQGDPQKNVISNEIYMTNEVDLQRFHYPHPILFTSEKDESIVQQESYITQFKDLISKDFGENTDLIHNLVKDLFIAGIIQSGITDAGIGYYKYIPTEFKSKLLKESLDELKKLLPTKTNSVDSAQQKTLALFLNAFKDRFKKNNPTYFKKEDSTEMPYLGKPYNLTNKIYKESKPLTIESVSLNKENKENFNKNTDSKISLSPNVTDEGEDAFIVKKGDEPVGEIKIYDDGTHLMVNNSVILAQKEGIGTEAYTQLAKVAEDRGLVLSSDLINSKMSDAAKGLWDSFVRKGLATKGGERYIWNSPKDSSIQKAIIDKSLSWGVIKNLPVFSDKGINVMRVEGTNKHFGNPFTANPKLTSLILMPDIPSAVQAYIDWLNGSDDQIPENQVKKLDERRDWILDQLPINDKDSELSKALKEGKKLLYMNDKGEYYSHGDALADIINGKDSNFIEKTNNEILFEVYLKQNQYYFYNIPSNLKGKAFDDAWENESNKTRVTPQNYERAKALNKEYGDMFFIGKQIAGDPKEDMEGDDEFLSGYETSFVETLNTGSVVDIGKGKFKITNIEDLGNGYAFTATSKSGIDVFGHIGYQAEKITSDDLENHFFDYLPIEIVKKLKSSPFNFIESEWNQLSKEEQESFIKNCL